MDDATEHLPPAYCPVSGTRLLDHWTLLLERLMGSRAMVIDHVFLEHPLEMPLVQDQHVVQTFLTHGPDPPLRKGVGLWCVIGRLDDCDTLGSKDGIEGHCEFAITIMNEEVRWQPFLLENPTKLPRLLRDPGRCRVRGTPGKMHAARSKFKKKEDVECLQPHRFDRKEVARQDLVFVVTQEGAPGATGLPPCWCWRYRMSFEYMPNRGSTNGVATLVYFPVQLPVSPTRILVR